jgi:hypothetical protein
MKKLLAFLIVFLLVIGVGSAYALDITIFDRVFASGGGGWYNRGNSPGENEEVEPNCLTGQAWDLEKFLLVGTKLTMIGGYNFTSGYQGWDSGDIFIDTNLDAVYGTAANGTGSGNSSRACDIKVG